MKSLKAQNIYSWYIGGHWQSHHNGKWFIGPRLGVGGIEAEAGMLGQIISMLIPEVIGFNLFNKMPEGNNCHRLSFNSC